MRVEEQQSPGAPDTGVARLARPCRRKANTPAPGWQVAPLDDQQASRVLVRPLAEFAHCASPVMGRLGRFELRALSAAVIDDFRAGLERDAVGAPTVLKALTVLSSILRYAVVR